MEAYLSDEVFASANSLTVLPDAADAEGMDKYAARFVQALEAEKTAAESMKLG